MGDFTPLSPEDLAYLSPDELKLYTHQLNFELAKDSPLDLACWISPQTVRTPHLEYVNDRIVALFEYRLYHHRGPGPEARWFYREQEDSEPIEVDSPFDLPFDDPEKTIFEFWGEHPDDPTDRIVFNLGIAVPPRHGKSWIVTEHLPLWLWLRWPDMHIGFGTYSDDFAQKWGKKLRARINENGQKLGLTLPGGDRHDSQHLHFVETAGEMFLVGTGGSMTGRGWQAGLIDDPLKDAAEAMSPAIRNSKAEWYEAVFDTRQTYQPFFPIAVQIMMFTRWHEDDPAGRFIYDDQKQVRPTWHMIRLPALAEEDDPLGRKPGEALWPRVMTAKQLMARRDRDPLFFGAMFQGWPTMGDKGLFGKWSTYHLRDGVYSWTEDGQERRVNQEDCIRFAVLDTAYTKNTWSDFTVFAVAEYSQELGRTFLLHVEREKLSGPELKEWLEAQWARWTPTFVGIEDVTSGKQLIQDLQKGTTVVHRPLYPDKDKVARAMGYATAVQIGMYLLPAEGQWVHDWREEHSLFPDSGKHDDQVDSGAYLHWVVQRMPKLRVDATNRHIVDMTAEGRVKRMQERMDAEVKGKNKRARNSSRYGLSGRLGR